MRPIISKTNKARTHMNTNPYTCSALRTILKSMKVECSFALQQQQQQQKTLPISCLRRVVVHIRTILCVRI